MPNALHSVLCILTSILTGIPSIQTNFPPDEEIANRSSQIIDQTGLLCPNMSYHCDELPAYCLSCDFNYSCVYGSSSKVSCRPESGVSCQSTHLDTPSTNDSSGNYSDYTMEKTVTCRYCHQLNDDEVTCLGRADCYQTDSPRSYYETLCEPLPHILCLGRRVFRRMLPCEWSSGKSYLTTVLLSLFLGGFGADRFYLGLWMSGLGKLFSFGGLGVWSIVDFILILAGYVKPPEDAVYW